MDGPSRPSRQPISVPHICGGGEGLQNQTSMFGVPTLPGLQAKAPQISLAGWERAHTYLSGRTVKLGLLLSKGGRSTLGIPGPFSGHDPGGKKSESVLGRRWPQTGYGLHEGRGALQMPLPPSQLPRQPSLQNE